MTASSASADCASEPIRVPGAIQPHGWLLAISAASGEPLAWSDNWAGLAEADAALPTALAAYAAGLRKQAASLIDGEGPISLGEVCRTVAQEMQRLTGFGRCLIYRFDADGHGEVLAESLDAGYQSYLGHRFPAADIPAQARALSKLNHLRLIPDANYAPVPVRFADSTSAALTLDLSQVQLCSVSPVHLEYMRNMGTLASMSVSIIVRGELWGLISCHNHEPADLPYPTRMACEHLGQLLSLQIEVKEENEQVSEQLRLRQLTLAMVAHLADSDATLQRLVDEPGPLLRMGLASGAAVSSWASTPTWSSRWNSSSSSPRSPTWASSGPCSTSRRRGSLRTHRRYE